MEAHSQPVLSIHVWNMAVIIIRMAKQSLMMTFSLKNVSPSSTPSTVHGYIWREGSSFILWLFFEYLISEQSRYSRFIGRASDNQRAIQFNYYFYAYGIPHSTQRTLDIPYICILFSASGYNLFEFPFEFCGKKRKSKLILASGCRGQFRYKSNILYLVFINFFSTGSTKGFTCWRVRAYFIYLWHHGTGYRAHGMQNALMKMNTNDAKSDFFNEFMGKCTQCFYDVVGMEIIAPSSASNAEHTRFYQTRSGSMRIPKAKKWGAHINGIHLSDS